MGNSQSDCAAGVFEMRLRVLQIHPRPGTRTLDLISALAGDMNVTGAAPLWLTCQS